MDDATAAFRRRAAARSSPGTARRAGPISGRCWRDRRAGQPRPAGAAARWRGRRFSRHAYPTLAMAGDYLRAAAGLVPSAALLATVSVAPCRRDGPRRASPRSLAPSRSAPCCATAPASRSATMGVRAIGAAAPRRSPGTELDRMKLGYYSTRRDRRAGWMQLELGAGGVRIKLDSRLDGFDELVRARRDASRPTRPRSERGDGRQSAGARHPAAGTRGRAVSDLLQVRDLHVRFAAPGGYIRAVKRRLVPHPAGDRPWRWSANRARANRSSARRSCASCRATARSPTARSCSPTRGTTDGSVDLVELPADGAGDAGAARRADLDHLPGADELAVAAAHDRRPGQRGAAAASRRAAAPRPRS